MDSRCGQHGGGSNTGLRVEMSGHTWEALQVEHEAGIEECWLNCTRYDAALARTEQLICGHGRESLGISVISS